MGGLRLGTEALKFGTAVLTPNAPARPITPTNALLTVLSVVVVSVPVAGVPVAFPLRLVPLGEEVVMTVVFVLGVVTVVPLGAALVDAGATGVGIGTDEVGATSGTPDAGAVVTVPGAVCAVALEPSDATTTTIATIGGTRRNLIRILDSLEVIDRPRGTTNGWLRVFA